MRISVGIDIAKEVHWVTAIDHEGVVRIDRKLANTPATIASLIDELKQHGGPCASVSTWSAASPAWPRRC